MRRSPSTDKRVRVQDMSNLIESHKFLSTYAWREGHIPEEVSNVLEILNTMINRELEEAGL